MAAGNGGNVANSGLSSNDNGAACSGPGGLSFSGLMGRQSTSHGITPPHAQPGSLAVAAGSAVLGAATLPTTASPVQSGRPPKRFDEDVMLPLIKLVVLGAPGVGKTSLVKRFVANDFNSEHVKTTKKAEYFPSLILNDSLFELKIIDLPTIPFFPTSSEVEWKEFRFFGLRSASAYLLVYDVSKPATFQYVKRLREQMIEARDMSNVPIIVAANKSDLAAASLARLGPGSTSSEASEKELSRVRKDIANLVRKSWRSCHVECSAKFNWNVVNVFKELAVTLDMVANGQMIGGSNGHVKKKRCLVF